MKLKPLKTIQQLEYTASKIQGYFQEFINQFIHNPFLSGVLLDVTIAVTDTAISHGLQAEPTGWIVLDKNANSNIWKISQTDKQLVLKASATVTVRLWVF